MTHSGKGCKRKVNIENGKCYQHQAVAVTSLPTANVIVPEPSPVKEHTPPSDTELDSLTLTPSPIQIVQNTSLDTSLESPFDLGEIGKDSFVALEIPLVPPPTLTTNLADPLDEEEKMLRISFWDKARLVMLRKGN
jgi:hypothetical protein